jgi:hypothetical protein
MVDERQGLAGESRRLVSGGDEGDDAGESGACGLIWGISDGHVES